jgi:putative MATE family efflux protein
MNSKATLTQGPVRKQLIKMTMSMLMGMLGMSLFNLTDTFFIGKLGSNELAAMNFTISVVFMITSIALGLGIGASSVISRAIGEGNREKVIRLTSDALFLSLFIILFIAIFGYMNIDALFTTLGATSELIPLIKDYMQIWFLGVPFLIIPMVGNSIIRATGDVLSPSKIMLYGFFINFVLDPIFIFGFGPIPPLGLKGAAIATVIARAFTLVLSFNILYRRKKIITFKLPSISKVISSWKELLYIGLPAAATHTIMPLSIGIITKIISLYGIPAIAAYGVGLRIELLAMTLIWTLSSVLAPFIGQNWGAKLLDRIHLGIKFSNIFSIIWGVVVFFIFLIFSSSLISLFNPDETVVNIGAIFLIIISTCYGFKGIVLLSSSVCSAIKRPFSAAILSLLQLIILRIPFVLIGSYLFGLKGIFVGIACSDFISAIISIVRVKTIMEISKPKESLMQTNNLI